ncbi:MAG TPA: purine-nucleoside phosphorylase [Actinomycetota bacterium]|nr:purine-nucleoside phosphorylase [Actinomycetota bacterium]
MTGLPGPGDGLDAEAAAAVRSRTAFVPRAAVVLGSGLGEAVRALREEASFAFEELPGFPRPTVPGHAGRLALGELGGAAVACFLGRVHFYEGHPMARCTLPVRLARALGADVVVLTAAVGGIDPALAPGTIAVGRDHLNMMGENPLRGWRHPDGTPAFVDLSRVYDPGLADLAEERARALGVPTGRGVYAAMPGPTYETPAEVEFLRRAGGTVVGMSVVPEAVAAAALGMRVLGLFTVTNAVGIHVAHEEVVRVSRAAAAAVGTLLADLLPRIVGEEPGWTAT